jgi:hypothetical protein
MRTAFVILIGLIAISPACAETPARPAAEQPVPAVKVLPLKGASGTSACSAYGAGFAHVEGSGTCVKVGGSIDVGVAASSRR